LAATIAHEINNPLEAVSNLLFLLNAHASIDPAGREYVNMAQQELDRIAHIVKQTLGFYREARSPVPVQLTELIDNVLDLYARKLSSKAIRLNKQYDSPGAVEAFPGEMRQVFSNLIVNALDATAHGGTLRLHVYPGCDWRDPNRRGIRVVVADTGIGISAEHRRHIFEPFFTTKGEKGTGLGLWVSYGIVRKHNGTLRVRSSIRPGRTGTAFSIFLPESSIPAPLSGNTKTKAARRAQ
jgi:signal transduction histidine kinase